MRQTYSRGWRLVFIVVGLALATMSTSCSSTATDSAIEFSSTYEFVDYTNDEFGFTAQFPAKQGEDTASWGDRNGSLFTVDSFDAPPGYDPTVQGVAVPRTVLKVYRPDDWPRTIPLSEVYEGWQLEEQLRSDLESEIPPLLMQSTRELDPPIEFALRNGHPSATTIFSLANSERTIWCYAVVVYQDDGDTFSLAGLRETESEAIAAEASFRLIGSDSDAGNPEPAASPDTGPTYSDPRWPTSNPELLAIPEADRWYNSWKRVGSYGTIAGPVASVAYLDNRVMINIGADYPDPSRAQVVIWPEYVQDFQDTLSDIDHGGAWLSISGQIGHYDGVPQIDPGDGPVEWRWWPGP